MGLLTVKTINSREVWSKGDMTIWELQLDFNGKQMRAKTYSRAISQPGWSGEVETYEKQGRNGSETFVKQPQQEGFSGGGRRSYSGGKSNFSSDNYTMYLSYAKDLAIACINNGKFSEELFSSLVTAVEAGGAQLYAGRPGAEPKVETTDVVNVKELDEAFGEANYDAIDIDEQELPWGTAEK